MQPSSYIKMPKIFSPFIKWLFLEQDSHTHNKKENIWNFCQHISNALMTTDINTFRSTKGSSTASGLICRESNILKLHLHFISSLC